MDYQRKWSLRFNSHGNVDILLVKTLLPRLQAFKLIPRRSGVRAPGYLSTEQRLESTTTEGAPVAEGKPQEANGIENSRITTETEAHSPLATAYACTVPGGRFPAKFGRQPIKLEHYPCVHAYPANYVRVHFRHLGVYKESQVAYRAIRVRVS